MVVGLEENIMSKEFQVLKSFEITKRLGDASSYFNVTFVTPLEPDEYMEGEVFEFVVFNRTLPESYTKFTGIIETIYENEDDNNKIYGLGGQNVGRLLLKQPFKLDCAVADGEDYTIEEILALIFVDTDIELGRGQFVLGEF